MVTESDGSPPEERIKSGNYIVIQRANYFKLHQLSDGNVVLGKDKVALGPVAGHRFWTTFKMIPKPGHRREYKLELWQEGNRSVSESVMKEVTSGVDNRHITDDGNAQAMSTHEIIELRDSGVSPGHVLNKLIANSKTFRSKTEYSQEKYLRKKESKYYEYLTVRKPTLRLLADIFFEKDQTKVMGLRYDTLSQIVTAANIQSRGTYLLFESGTQALVGASVLNSLHGGVLINISLGNQPQKQAVLAMNFPKLDSFLCVKASSLIDSLYPEKNGVSVDSGSDAAESKGNTNDNDNSRESNTENSQSEITNSNTENSLMQVNDDDSDESKIYGVREKNSEGCSSEQQGQRKRRADTSGGEQSEKRPRWAQELETASSLLRSNGADALIVASKEFPLDILTRLLPFVKASRPLVIYSLYREPLVQLYVELKKRGDVINLHLTETWLRSYQVLPDRTHPNVTMSSAGGHLLTGIVVKP